MKKFFLPLFLLLFAVMLGSCEKEPNTIYHATYRDYPFGHPHAFIINHSGHDVELQYLISNVPYKQLVSDNDTQGIYPSFVDMLCGKHQCEAVRFVYDDGVQYIHSYRELSAWTADHLGGNYVYIPQSHNIFDKETWRRVPYDTNENFAIQTRMDFVISEDDYQTALNVNGMPQ